MSKLRWRVEVKLFTYQLEDLYLQLGDVAIDLLAELF